MKFVGVFLTICVFRALSSKSTTEDAVTQNDNANKTVKCPSHIILRLASKKFLLCEGFLIGKNAAVTAAGCVDKYKSIPNSLEVVAGVNSIQHIESEKTTQKRRVSEIIIHPDFFSSQTGSGDIAIIKVLRPFKITENVNISFYGNESAANRNVRLVGFGDDDKKTETRLKLFSMNDCKDFFHTKFEHGWFCAKLIDNEDKTFQYTKSSYAGAPLYYSDINEFVACGLSPFRSSSAYINLNIYVPWIENVSNVNRTKTPLPITYPLSTSTEATFSQTTPAFDSTPTTTDPSSTTAEQ